jgi:hypothetical protein
MPARVTQVPIFAWTFHDNNPNDSQFGAWIRVGSTIDNDDLWDWVDTAHTSLEKVYAGAELTRGRTYYVRMLVRDSQLEWQNADNHEFWTRGSFTVNRLPFVSSLLIDGKVNPQDLETSSPLFEWGYTDEDGDSQVKYNIQVGTSENASDMWDYSVSGGENSVIYGGEQLNENTIYHVRIRVFDNLEWSVWTQGTFLISPSPLPPVAAEGPPGGGVLPPPDAIPPEMEVLQPTTPTVGENVKVRVRVWDENGVDVDSISAALDGTPVFHTWLDGVVEINLVGLSAGDHLVGIKASDQAGNENSVLIQFTVVLEVVPGENVIPEEALPTENIALPVVPVENVIPEEIIPTENIAPPPEEVAPEVDLEVATEEGGVAKVENGRIEVTLVFKNPTGNPVTKTFKMVFGETEVLVEVKLSPWENTRLTVFLSVEGMERGTHRVSVIDPETGETIDVETVVLAAAPPPKERREPVAVVPTPPLNILHLLIAGFAIAGVAAPLGISILKMRRKRILGLRGEKVTARVKLKLKGALASVRTEKITARVKKRLLLRSTLKLIEAERAVPGPARIARMADEVGAKLLEWGMEPATAEEVTERVKKKLLMEFRKRWKREALKKEAEPLKAEEVAERAKRRLMRELDKRRVEREVKPATAEEITEKVKTKLLREFKKHGRKRKS